MSVPTQIAWLEESIKQELMKMVQQGRFGEVIHAISQTFSGFKPEDGAYKLVFQGQTMGFGQSREIPASVNLLGCLATGVTTREKARRSQTTVGYGAVSMVSNRPCPCCRGSGIAV